MGLLFMKHPVYFLLLKTMSSTVVFRKFLHNLLV